MREEEGVREKEDNNEGEMMNRGRENGKNKGERMCYFI